MLSLIVTWLCLIAFSALVTLLVLRFALTAGADTTPSDTTVNDQRPFDVRSLVPSECSANPDAPTAGFLRQAFVAHVQWLNMLPVIVTSWSEMVRAPMGPDTRFTSLAELYARAIFECAFARHFDGADPCTDVVVLEQIANAYGESYALRVHDSVAACGVVLRHPTEMRNNAKHR